VGGLFICGNGLGFIFVAVYFFRVAHLIHADIYLFALYQKLHTQQLTYNKCSN
jgi:hypothetical protein